VLGTISADGICTIDSYIFPDNVSALAEELRNKLDFAWGPEVMEYGMGEFAVHDPNGYSLLFRNLRLCAAKPVSRARLFRRNRALQNLVQRLTGLRSYVLNVP
jgi:hypothetical protein